MAMATKTRTDAPTMEGPSITQQDLYDVEMAGVGPGTVADSEAFRHRSDQNEARISTNASKNSSRASSPTKEKAPRLTTSSSRHMARPVDKMQKAPESFTPEVTKEKARADELERENSALKIEMMKLNNEYNTAIAQRSEIEMRSNDEKQRLLRDIDSLNQGILEKEHECKMVKQKAQEDVNDMYKSVVSSKKTTAQLEKKLAAAEKEHRDRLENMEVKYEYDKAQLRKNAEYHYQMSQQEHGENEKLRQRVGQQEATVTKAQNAAFNVLSQSLSAKLPDDRIRQRFKELFERIAEWARENATRDMSILEDPENIDRWQQDGLLRRVGRPGDAQNLEFNFKEETAADTLLNAALTGFLCQDFLNNPFFFAEHLYPLMAIDAPKEQRLETGEALKRLLHGLQKEHSQNEAEAHKWRAATVEALTNSIQTRRPLQTYFKQYMDKQLIEDCRELIRKDVQDADLSELLQIVESFGEFVIELWSQRCNIRYYCLKDLENKVYRYGDKEIEIARAVGLDDGDTSLDGRPIPVFVQPLIVGFGTVDGRDYREGRIWSRAVVWVAKDAKRPVAPMTAKNRWWLF